MSPFAGHGKESDAHRSVRDEQANMAGVNDHRGELVADCRLRAATDLFGHTWDPVVLAALREGPRRRHELRSGIGGLSDKVLSDALHRLLGNGLVERRAHRQAPPSVEYRLTELGESLVNGPMKALGSWVIEHGDELLNAQGRADS
jgi:DNA-binding HxlR family transcriptional regulator